MEVLLLKKYISMASNRLVSELISVSCCTKQNTVATKHFLVISTGSPCKLCTYSVHMLDPQCTFQVGNQFKIQQHCNHSASWLSLMELPIISTLFNCWLNEIGQELEKIIRRQKPIVPIWTLPVCDTKKFQCLMWTQFHWVLAARPFL